MYTIYKLTVGQHRGKVGTDVLRRQLAEFASKTMDVGQHTGAPYFNSTDDFWVLDGMNNWFMRFHEDEPLTFSIEHRYSDQDGIEAISKWLAYKLEARIETITVGK